jgi:hypothetical protein
MPEVDESDARSYELAFEEAGARSMPKSAR